VIRFLSVQFDMSSWSSFSPFQDVYYCSLIFCVDFCSVPVPCVTSLAWSRIVVDLLNGVVKENFYYMELISLQQYIQPSLGYELQTLKRLPVLDCQAYGSRADPSSWQSACR